MMDTYNISRNKKKVKYSTSISLFLYRLSIVFQQGAFERNSCPGFFLLTTEFSASFFSLSLFLALGNRIKIEMITQMKNKKTLRKNPEQNKKKNEP